MASLPLISLVDNQKPILGVIYAPAIQALYFSLQGMGAYRVLIDSGESLPLDELLTKVKNYHWPNNINVTL